jgi:spermidine/putrescine transport system permease protein
MVLIAISNYDSSVSLNQINISLNHWSILIQRQNVIAFRNSVVFAIATTFISFVLGYFAAYYIFQSKFKNKFIILTIVILPMWSNLILRVDALNNIFSQNNIISSIIGFSPFGNITGKPIAILIGLVFTYLPFVIMHV